jgi:hypothetical protein
MGTLRATSKICRVHQWRVAIPGSLTDRCLPGFRGGLAGLARISQAGRMPAPRPCCASTAEVIAAHRRASSPLPRSGAQMPHR